MSEAANPKAIFKQWLLPTNPTTVFFASPSVELSLLNASAKPQTQHLNLRLCASAGNHMQQSPGEKFKAMFGCETLYGVGSNQMLHVFLSNTPSDLRYGSCGKAVRGNELSLRLDNGQCLSIIGDRL